MHPRFWIEGPRSNAWKDELPSRPHPTSPTALPRLGEEQPAGFGLNLVIDAGWHLEDAFQMMSNSSVHEVAGGEITLWAEPGSSVMLKLTKLQGDPVELGEGELEELIEVLQRLRREIT